MFILLAIFLLLKLSKYLYYNVFDDYLKEKTWRETIKRIEKKK